MLWPLVLPFNIAFWVLTTAVVAITSLAPFLKWKRGKTFLVASIFALIAFIPSCTGIMFVLDDIRFGQFEYESFSDVNDFRAQRYLPTAASNIEMFKHENGYHARYSISEADFRDYLDRLWDKYGENSAVKRGEMFGEGSTVSKEELEQMFSELGWKPLENAIKYYSPSEADGGGATYYYDSDSGIAMQRTGYW